MCCIAIEISVYVQSSGGHVGFCMGDLPSFLMDIISLLQSEKPMD